MKRFFRTAIFILFFSAIVRAETGVPREQSQSFKSAQAAFDEGIFDVAEQRLSAFLKKYPDSTDAARARLLDGQALYRLGKYDAALSVLQSGESAEALQSEFLFWEGETLLAAEQWTLAENKYRELESKAPQSPQATEGKLGLAWALFKQKKEKEANDLLSQLGVDQANTEIGQRAILTLAKFEISKNDLAPAQSQLELILSQQPKPDLFFEASYWLGALYFADKKFDQAALQYQKITTDKKAFPKALVAQAWFGLAQTHQALNQPENALDAFEQTYTLSDNEKTKLSAFKSYLDCARALKRLPEAVAKLTEFSKKSSARPDVAAAVFFALAQAEEEDQDNDKAAVSFENLLNTYPKSDWRAAAQFELGKLYESSKKIDLAIKNLQSCATENLDPELARSAQFELGKIYYQQKDDVKAQAAFKRLIEEKDNLAEEAWYNLLLSEDRQNQLDAFLKTQDQFSAAFPQSQFNDRVALLKGDLQNRMGEASQARSTYEKALLDATNDSQKALLRLRIADLVNQSGKKEEASQLYEKFLSDFPTDPNFPDAALKGIVVDLAIKKIPEEQAIVAMLALWKKFPQNPKAPEILFYVAEYYFNHQDYVNAEIRFAQIGKEYPQSFLADDAFYWAGVAAAAHDDETGAIPLLEAVPENSPWKVEARLMQAKIYYHQLKFENALTLLDAVLNTEKAGPRYVEATLRKGDCYFALGEKDNSNYEKAAAAYGVIINSEEGNLPQRNEAGFRRGKCLEKLGRVDDALALYLDVFYGRLALAEGPQVAAAPPPESLWEIKAGLEAARIKEEEQDWHSAIEIYRGLEQRSGPNQEDFQEVINRIRRDHYLYE